MPLSWARQDVGGNRVIKELLKENVESWFGLFTSSGSRRFQSSLTFLGGLLVTCAVRESALGAGKACVLELIYPKLIFYNDRKR